MCNNLATVGSDMQFKRENILEGYSLLGIFTWMVTHSGLSLSLSLAFSNTHTGVYVYVSLDATRSKS